jgi:phosphatidylserine decarboxylase
MVRDGIPFVLVPLVAGFIFFFLNIWIVAALLIILALFMVYFFRDPKRNVPVGDDLILSAADGRVTRIENLETGRLISVFLSPLDVHVNRSPISGRIESVTYSRGRKLPATSEQASLVNERNSLTIVGAKMTVICTQIAGILARRIVCWNKAGDELAAGQRFGMIKFGSRTDLLIPQNTRVEVSVGQRVVGGETIIARLITTNDS